jgi:protein kinase X
LLETLGLLFFFSLFFLLPSIFLLLVWKMLKHSPLFFFPGNGAFGRVRLCKHLQTSKFFCVKIISKAKIVRYKQLEHLRNEKDVLLATDHPFIVKL